MNIASIYRKDASEQWFELEYGSRSVHDNLRHRGFEIIGRPLLLSSYAQLTIPIDRAELSWGAILPCPLKGRSTAFVAAYPYDLKSMYHDGESLESLVNRWLGMMPCQTKFLASLHESAYLVSAARSIAIADVHEVTGIWNIDAYVGVFDESSSMIFVFDVEFGSVYVSFDDNCLPDGFEDFARVANAKFRDVFVRDAKFRTGADPARAEEYFRVALEPAM